MKRKNIKKYSKLINIQNTNEYKDRRQLIIKTEICIIKTLI